MTKASAVGLGILVLGLMSSSLVFAAPATDTPVQDSCEFFGDGPDHRPTAADYERVYNGEECEFFGDGPAHRPTAEDYERIYENT